MTELENKRFDERIMEFKRRGYIVPSKKIIKTKGQIDGIRESGKINIAVLDYVVSHVEIGMSTEEIDQMVYQKTKEFGGIPGTLNYQGFPKSSCTSINDQISHGKRDPQSPQGTEFNLMSNLTMYKQGSHFSST